MKEESGYIQKYKASWDSLEKYIDKIKRKGYASLAPEELKDYLHLLKRTSHHLAYARTHYPNSDLCRYLNELCIRANNHLYAVKKSGWQVIWEYLSYGFAVRVKQYYKYVLFSIGLFAIGIILSSIMVLQNEQYAAYFLPQDFLNMDHGNIKQSGWNQEMFTILSSTVMANNIFVTIKSFAGGITGALYTIRILIINGGVLGALSTLVAINSTDMTGYWSLILPHGFLELTAIFIGGASGLMMGKALWLPGGYTRKDALIKAAKEAVTLMPGAILMLIIAGLIEGFFTPAKIDPWIKLVFAGCTLILMVLYFLWPRKKAKTK